MGLPRAQNPLFSQLPRCLRGHPRPHLGTRGGSQRGVLSVYGTTETCCAPFSWGGVGWRGGWVLASGPPTPGSRMEPLGPCGRSWSRNPLSPGAGGRRCFQSCLKIIPGYIRVVFLWGEEVEGSFEDRSPFCSPTPTPTPHSVMKRAEGLALRISFSLNLGVTEASTCCDSCLGGGQQISSGRGLSRPSPFPEAGPGLTWGWLEWEMWRERGPVSGEGTTPALLPV